MKQITILSVCGKDLITEITHILSERGISLDSVTARNFGHQSIATITTHNHDLAMEALQEYNHLQVVSEDALLVRIEDELGSLAKLARRFTDQGIDIRSLRFVERHQGFALVAIGVERSDKVLEIVKDILVS
jgi:hypothetical protein